MYNVFDFSIVPLPSVVLHSKGCWCWCVYKQTWKAFDGNEPSLIQLYVIDAAICYMHCDALPQRCAALFHCCVVVYANQRHTAAKISIKIWELRKVHVTLSFSNKNFGSCTNICLKLLKENAHGLAVQKKKNLVHLTDD